MRVATLGERERRASYTTCSMTEVDRFHDEASVTENSGGTLRGETETLKF